MAKRNETVCGKVMFLHISDILFTGCIHGVFLQRGRLWAVGQTPPAGTRKVGGTHPTGKLS